MSVVIDPAPVKQEPPAPVVMMPDECPRTGRIRNFKVEVAAFGAYKRGSILPKHVLLRSAGAGAVGREDALIATMLESRKFSQTYEPVNVQLAEVKAKGADQVVPSLTRDVNDARAKLAKVEQDLVQACAEREAAKSQLASRDKSLGEYSDKIANLEGQLAARDALMDTAQAEIAVLTRRVDELTAQLDEATKPVKKAVKS